ncbi:hypothetical protein ACFRMN_30770 [Streptomyces sp. NPDC056835]|uniref:hypothetical protein n=1 Tax=Streptomyces sp. NPDC056835 TaxID=3345956 RepID=UPI0036BB5DB0
MPQLNPDTLERSVAPQAAGGSGDSGGGGSGSGDRNEARTRNAYARRRDLLRQQQRTRQEQRQRQRDQRRRNENSTESKDDQLRKIVARIRPKLYDRMRNGIPRSPFLGPLNSMKLYYRLTGLAPIGGVPFTVVPSLNPSRPVLGGEAAAAAVTALSNLTLGEYPYVLAPEDHWNALNCNADQQTVRDSRTEGAKFRNELMHFDPNPTQDRDLSPIQGALKMLRALYPIA